jgi:uncharacterized SAM-binding protein YcdF (DUF218 family)
VQRGGSSSPLVILSRAKNLVVTAEIPRSALRNDRSAQNDKLRDYFRRAALVTAHCSLITGHWSLVVMRKILTAFRARPRWQQRVIKLILFVAFVVVAFVLPRHFWLMKTARFLIVEDTLKKCDVIVALAYPRDMRVRHAIQLYQKGYGNYVAFNFGIGPRTNVPNIFRNEPKVSPQSVTKEFAQSNDVPSEKVVIQSDTTGTYDEAVQLKNMMRERGFKSAIIVTSALHTRRAAVAFHKVFRGENARLLFYGVPVEEEKMSLDDWWTREDELIYVFEEWIKLVFYFVKYYL